MDWSGIDWQALERLRSAFLEGPAGRRDYWQSESDLFSYDQTFAQRIGWKWDAVLAELQHRGWTPPEGEIMDWGCGSGVAGRAYLDCFGLAGVSELRLWDRSTRAVQFAQRRAADRFPGLRTWVAAGTDGAPKILLLSHVLTELEERQLDELLEFAAKATTVLWVEPGTHQASRRLMAVRERLRPAFHLIAPCTHQCPCGLLTAENAAHWCHHFASPPPEVFTDGNWARFAGLAGIDLRSLPLSYLVLDQRPAPALPPGAVRIIGRPRIYKAHALILGCTAQGVQERRLSKRNLPEQFRDLKKGQGRTLQLWECAGQEIVKCSSSGSGR